MPKEFVYISVWLSVRTLSAQYPNKMLYTYRHSQPARARSEHSLNLLFAFGLMSTSGTAAVAGKP